MLIIFDCDGVLVDSESLAADVFAEQLQRVGVALSAAQCLAQFKGLTLSACMALVEQHHRCVLPEDFLSQLKHQTRLRFARDLKPVAGIGAVLSWLDLHGHAKCVASNGGAEKIAHSLTVTGLADSFPNAFSAEHVGRGKPAPDLFLHAASSMGFSVEQCVVVEDSAAGVQAALAAGITPLLYLGESVADPSAWTEVVSFRCMSQLPDLVLACGR